MTIDFRTPPELTLFPETEEQDITQNIYCIVNTVLGSVPLIRDYGLDMTFMHIPMQAAQTMVITAISDAVRRYEPRVSISNITFDDNTDQPDQLIPIVEVTFNE